MELVLTGKEGDIQVDDDNFNNIIRALRVTESITTNPRFTATSRKKAETVQSNIDVRGVMEVALTPEQGKLLFILRRRQLPFDIISTVVNAAGDTLDIKITGCKGEGDTELGYGPDVEDGIHYEFPFQANTLELV